MGSIVVRGQTIGRGDMAGANSVLRRAVYAQVMKPVSDGER